MYRPLPSIGSKSCLWVVGWMYQVDVYLRVRRAVMVDGMSIREVSRVFGLHRDTVRKILAYSAPPGYRRQTPPRRPKLEPFTAVIDQILVDDLRRPRKQRHTAQRIFQRLRDEHGFGGQYTIVKDYVREHRRRSQEMFVPLSPSAGPRPVRLWRGPGDHRRGGTESPLLRPGPAPQRRLLRQGLPGRDHRGLPWTATCRPSPSWAERPRASSTTTPSWRWPGSWVMDAVTHPGLHGTAVPLPVR